MLRSARALSGISNGSGGDGGSGGGGIAAGKGAARALVAARIGIAHFAGEGGIGERTRGTLGSGGDGSVGMKSARWKRGNGATV